MTTDFARVLVITAHPDDVDFGAAGTVATWTQQGNSVAYCIVTDGDAGGFDDTIDRKEIPGIRRREQMAAAKQVGVTELHFLGHSDGKVVASLELRRDISRVIRIVRPDLVLCPSPERNYARMPASHPDHLASGEAALCAVYPDARNPYAFPELLAEGYVEHAVREIWMMGDPHPDHVVDITDTIDHKVAALLEHVSQLPEPDSIVGRIHEWTAQIALEAGLGSGRHAEAFRRVTIPI